MKDLSTKQNFVGCDVSKDTLDFALYEKGKKYSSFQHIKVDNNLEGFKAMSKWLRSLKVKIKDTVIAMEHTGFYSVALAEWAHSKKITFVFLHPMDVKNACSRGRNKTDKADAQFIADYVYTMREKLAPSTPEDSITKRLRQLFNERRATVKTRTRYLNLLKTLSDRESVKRVKKLIEILSKQIDEIEKQMKQVIKTDPDLSKNFKLLLSIQGIGLVNAVATIIATGNFTRFQTSRQYAKFICVSPMAKQSGTSINKGNHVSKAGHNELKAILTEGANSAVAHDASLKAYYNRKIAEGKTRECVLNAVKFKLVCRMFAVIKRQTPYVNTEKYRG